MEKKPRIRAWIVRTLGELDKEEAVIHDLKSIAEGNDKDFVRYTAIVSLKKLGEDYREITYTENDLKNVEEELQREKDHEVIGYVDSWFKRNREYLITIVISAISLIMGAIIKGIADIIFLTGKKPVGIALPLKLQLPSSRTMAQRAASFNTSCSCAR